MINNAKGLPNWKLWKKTFIKMDPSRKLVSDELIEDITDKINQLDGFSARIMMIAILENLTNEQLNSAAYWAFDLMSDRVDAGDLKITDVTVRDWLCHVSPSIRDLMLDELLKLQAKVDPAKANTVDSYVNVADQTIHILNPCSYAGEVNVKSEIATHVH